MSTNIHAISHTAISLNWGEAVGMRSRYFPRRALLRSSGRGLKRGGGRNRGICQEKTVSSGAGLEEQSLSGRKGTRLVSQGGREGDGSVVAMGREIGWVDDGEE
jgi:hypothetical protein